MKLELPYNLDNYESKEFDIGVFLTGVSDVVMCEDFDDFTDFCEFVLGRTLKSHHLSMDLVHQTVKACILTVHPELDEINLSDVNKDNWKTYYNKAVKIFGNKLNMFGSMIIIPEPIWFVYVEQFWRRLAAYKEKQFAKAD